jgi:iron complex transport system substrate-binding protein
VVLDQPAEKIISISPSTTEILFAVGAGDKVIARDSNSIFPEEALNVQDLGAMWEGVPVEDILALEPDLVVMGENFSQDNAEQLRDLGITVFWQANPFTFDGLYENLREISKLAGTEIDAEELILTLKDRVAAVDSAVAGVEDIPLVFYELDATDPANPWTAGAGTFISYVIDRAKGQNLGDVLEGSWAQISSEELIKQDPDFILLSDAFFGITVESVAERPGWEGISAVVNENVVAFDPNILSVPGPRLVDGLEAVAAILHPDLFQ